jgi:hypothetical protein
MPKEQRATLCVRGGAKRSEMAGWACSRWRWLGMYTAKEQRPRWLRCFPLPFLPLCGVWSRGIGVRLSVAVNCRTPPRHEQEKCGARFPRRSMKSFCTTKAEGAVLRNCRKEVLVSLSHCSPGFSCFVGCSAFCADGGKRFCVCSCAHGCTCTGH